MMLSAAPSLLRRPLRLDSCSVNRFVRYLSSSKRSDPVLIYQRANNRVAFPRAVLALSSFNTLYWFWYTFDFIPTVNEASLGADYRLGYVGLSISLVLQSASVVYPQCLISKIKYDPIAQDLTVYTHDIPTVWASSFSRIHPLGSIKTDPAGADAKRLVSEQEFYRGSVALKVTSDSYTQLPLLVDLQEDDDLPDPLLFTKIFMTPEQLVHMPNSSNAKNGNNVNANSKKKKKTHRKKAGVRVPTPKRR